MAINFNHLSSTPSTNSREKVDAQTTTINNATNSSGSEKGSGQSTVQLSTEALALQQIEEQVGKLPDINESRIAAIKAALDDGSYSINPQSIADKMLAFEDVFANAGN